MSNGVNEIRIRPTLFPDSDPTKNKRYLVAEILVDEVVIADFRVFSTDLTELERSVTRDGDLYILTCWCGVAACTNARPVTVLHCDQKVRWSVQIHDTQFEYLFDETSYRRAVNTGIQDCGLAVRKRGATKKHSSTSEVGDVTHYKWLDDTC